MLEAVLIVSIMVSAVAFVVTFEQPDPPTYNARETLEVKARDALDILYDTPAVGENAKYGANELSAYIAKCLNGDCDELEAKLDKLVPPGAGYALYVSNGYDTHPVLLQGEPSDEAVTSSRTFEPAWSSTFLATATESIGTQDALLTYALPIFHSTPVSPGGSQIFVKVSGTRASDGSDYVLIASAATTAHAGNDPEAVAASLYFVDSAGQPLPVHNLTGPTLVPHRMTLRLAESEGAAIPAGAEVIVHTPRGWTAVAPQAANPDWTILENANDKNGSYVGSAIRAQLKEALREDVADLAFDLSYHGDALDFYPLTATLSKGANAMASTILRGEVHDVEPPLATPLLHFSVPSPMGGGAETTWTLSAHIPVNDSGHDQVTELVRVHTVELIEQEGNAIFGAEVTASRQEAMGGTWESTGTSLIWKGNVEMDVHNALNLTFRVGASGTAGPSEIRSHFVPPVSFDGWSGRLVGRTGWGFYRQSILPEDGTYAGYNRTAGILGTMHPLNSSGVYRNTELPGQIQYNVSLAGAVEDSLYGSYVIAEKRSVPLGGEVVINANVQSVLFALAEAGQRAGVTLRFYPPWSGNDRVPEWTQPNLDQGLLTGEVTEMVTLDMNGDGYPDPIVGTSNGRVMAYNGLTGQRLQGNAFTVPLTQLAKAQQAVSRITDMATIRLYGEDYIVVGTDKNSGGVFVLDKSFKVVWSYTFPNDVLAIDTSTDFDPEVHPHPEIVVARAYELAAAKNAILYVLKAPMGGGTMQPMPGAVPPIDDPQALASSLGTPSTVLGQSSGGPYGGSQVVMVPVQTNFDPGLAVSVGATTPRVTKGPASTPRAGVQAVDERGITTGVLFGAPASVLRDYDYDGNAVRDLVMGGASGYVILANGQVLTQPAYSYIMGGVTRVISADTRSTTESYALAQDGFVFMTDDAWYTTYLAKGKAIGGRAISSDSLNSFWVVGTNNQVWRSQPTAGSPATPMDGRHFSSRDVVPFVLTATRATQPYNFATHIHELRDVHFRGLEGYIVGTGCSLPQVCTEPIFLRTGDGGVTWHVLSSADNTLLNRHRAALNKNMSEIEIVTHDQGWTGWIVGDGGLIVRSEAGGSFWQELNIPFTYDFNDIACLPGSPDTCWVVGDAGAAIFTTNARAEQPQWFDVTGKMGLPTDRPFYSIGFPEDTRGYIGSKNMLLASFGGADWTALPLNYFENDARVISTAGDGGGFALGGTDATGRIWLLHDYHTRSDAPTLSFADRFEPGARILSVDVVDGDITFAQQGVYVDVATNGNDWRTIGPLIPGEEVTDDKRKPVLMSTEWPDPAATGADLKAVIKLRTDPEKTILSPHVRALTLRAHYEVPDGAGGWDARSADIHLDFTSRAQLDEPSLTADWNTQLKLLRQPLVQEFWTRNVSGEVHDIQLGYDLDADGRHELWVATGDVLSENSPDYIIYAGTDPDRVMEKHNRVYLLNGRNGHPLAISEKLDGEVRQVRLADTDNDQRPDILFAATWDTSNEATAHGRIYALDPITLVERWSFDVKREAPVEIEIGKLPAAEPMVFVGAQRPAGDTRATPHLWGIRDTQPREKWSVLPDDLGKYLIRKEVEPDWLYGPHVVEIAVEWEETVTEVQFSHNLEPLRGVRPPPLPGEPETPEGSTVLRAARFYDHFMVTPPDAVSAPHPVYTARLLVWMRDWGG